MTNRERLAAWLRKIPVGMPGISSESAERLERAMQSMMYGAMWCDASHGHAPDMNTGWLAFWETLEEKTTPTSPHNDPR